jgi:putative ABC transport system permease protein
MRAAGVRALLALYPREFRARHGAELEAGFAECFRRERARLGYLGVPYAWLRLAADSIVSSAAARIDIRRRRRIAALHQLSLPLRETPMNNLWQDVRFAARGIRRTPGFSAVVIIILALAIGATTTIFGVVSAVLLRSLPYHEPQRLVMLYEGIGRAMSGPIGFSAPDFTAFEPRAHSFENLAAFRNKSYELSGIDQPDQITGLRVSASLLDALGVQPALGRNFTRDEDLGRRRVAILADGLWRRAFGGDPGILGRAVMLDRQPYTIIGVMPRRFVFPNRGPILNNQPANNQPAEIYVPISFTDRELAAFASMYNNSVVGRLKPGVTAANAESEARTIATQLVKEVYPAAMAGFDLYASATPIRDDTLGRIETTLYVLLAGVGVVLLIACADIANLMLTRMAAREREMAVRAALGAGRGRLIRQVLVESSLLALAGGAFGVLLAWWASRALVGFAPATIPRTTEIGLDGRVLVFAVVVSFVTALLCGTLPAWEASRKDAGDALKEGGRSGTAGTRQRRVFGALVTAQFALAVVLLAAGGLLIRSFARLVSVDPGFRVERVLTLGTSLPANAYPTGPDIRSFYLRLLERVDRLPAVTASAASTFLPLSVRERRSFSIESQPAASAGVPHVIANDWVLGRYFDAVGIPLKRGRYLQPGDRTSTEPVVVINETMARTFWPGQDPVGQRITWGPANANARWMRIVGIVANIKQGPLNSETISQTYQPWEQVPDGMIADNVVGALRSLNLVVRTATEPESLIVAIRTQIRELDPALPITRVQTMEDVIRASTGPQRFNTVLLGSFASVALLLAALGIAGVLATSVSRRTQEIGVRMALGAQRGDLLRMVVRQGMTLALAGLAIGVPTALLLTRLMSSLLFQTTPHDPITFASVATVLLVVAAIACYVPARRATRVDPMVALRYE